MDIYKWVVLAGAALAGVNMGAVVLGVPAWVPIGLLSGLAVVVAIVALKEWEVADELRRRLVIKQYKADLMRRRWLECREKSRHGIRR